VYQLIALPLSNARAENITKKSACPLAWAKQDIFHGCDLMLAMLVKKTDFFYFIDDPLVYQPVLDSVAYFCYQLPLFYSPTDFCL
jgi:hypothetical protein